MEQIEPVSTIGAGDNFNAGLVYGIHQKGVTREEIPYLGRGDWKALIQRAVDFSREVCLSYDNYISQKYAEKIKSFSY